MNALNKPQHTTFRFYGLFICGIAILFYFFDYFIQVSPSVMTSQLMHHFHIGAASLGVLGAFFYYTYLLMQIPAGILIDRYGPRIMITLAVILCAIGTLLVGATHLLWLAYLGRALTGIGSAFSFIGAITLIADWFEHKHFATLVGITQSGAALGSLFGLVLISYCVRSFGWQLTLINISYVTFVLALLSFFVIRKRHHADIKPQHAMHSIWQNIKKLLTYKQIWYIAIIGFLSWVPVATIGALWGVPFLSKAYHLSTIKASELCSAFWVGLGIISPVIGWFSDKYQHRRFFLALCFSIGFAASIGILYASHINIWIGGLLLFGLSFASSAQSLTFALVKDQVPKKVLGYASGFNNMAAIMGGAIAQTLVGILLVHSFHPINQYNLNIYSTNAFIHALSIIPISLLLGLIIILFFIKEPNAKP